MIAIIVCCTVFPIFIILIILKYCINKTSPLNINRNVEEQFNYDLHLPKLVFNFSRDISNISMILILQFI